MTAPVATQRQTPSGKRLGDGFQTLVTHSLDPDILLWEISVTPPGVVGGEPNDNATMHNSVWRTKSPRTLLDMTPLQMTCAYDPAVYPQIIALCNQRGGTITVTFPDGDTLAFYGYFQSFQPGEMAEGNRPTATVSIVPTNQDPVTCAEEGPVYTAAAGTFDTSNC